MISPLTDKDCRKEEVEIINLQSRFCVFCLIPVLIINQRVAVALPIGEAIQATADRLAANQITRGGPSKGSWPGEADYTGSIVSGMVNAYEVTCYSAYKSSANLGGDYILRIIDPLGDEVYALTRLSEIAVDPCNNSWRTAVSNFYANVKYAYTGGTKAYIAALAATYEPSTAVFYLADHAVAAYYVHAEDKQIWRGSTIDFLAKVDDSSATYPVLALGIATWALALTGPLDDTLVDPNGVGRPYWNGVTLAELPDLLAGHQMTQGVHPGSFYWRFDHTDGAGGTGPGAYGYTEDTVFGTLGLVAASQADAALDYESAILLARQVLLDAINAGGIVYEHLWLQGQIYYFYAGEMLSALGELVIAGDLDLDGCVDFIDFSTFANNWLRTGCTACSWCNWTDLDHSGEVNHVDLKIYAENWLEGASY